MDEKEKYAQEWNASADYFHRQDSYKKLAKHISGLASVLEIGCGTGQSTLALLDAKHSVVAIDRNPSCIERARDLIERVGFVVKENPVRLLPGEVCFMEYDVTDSLFENEILPELDADVVLCWNCGTYWDKEMSEVSIPKMFEYGLTAEQIRSSPESSYAEMMIWYSCKFAAKKGCAASVVDRTAERVMRFNDSYYCKMKSEFGFSRIKYKNIKARTLSAGGRRLVTGGNPNAEDELAIYFISILLR